MSSSRVKLTKTFIDQLEIAAIFRESELIGFAIRVNSICKRYMMGKSIGKRFDYIGRDENITLIQACKIAQDKLAQMGIRFQTK